MVGESDYKNLQLGFVKRELQSWLRRWDGGDEVPSIRITSGGPTQEQVAQTLLVALVRRLNGRIPKEEKAFLAHVDLLMIHVRSQGFDLSGSALAGVINFSYWMLRSGPSRALGLYPQISWQKVSRRWPIEPNGKGEIHA